MNTDNIIHLKEETQQILGCAMTVINTLGAGFLEKPYENALCVEFKAQNIPYQQQPRYAVIYKGVTVGDYIPDLVVFGKVIIELKTIDKITDHEKAQMLNYLKVTGLKVGLVINFAKSKLEWERIVL